MERYGCVIAVDSKMISPNSIKKSQAKRILKLLEECTRAEIMARIARIRFPEYADYYMIKLDKEKELREYVFGTDDLVVLGERWGILKKKTDRKRKKMRRKR